MRGTYFFSFRSPYSWLASVGLKRLIDAGDVLELVPFFEPDSVRRKGLEARGGRFPYTPMSDAKHRYILKDIKRLTSKLGVRHIWPVDRDPWWEASHLGYIQAVRLGFGLPFFWEIYRARWQLGLDISQTEAIEQVCKNIGLTTADTQLICDAPRISPISDAGVDALYRIHMEDVFGVPMFTRRRQQFWGLDRLSDFVNAIEATDFADIEGLYTADYPLEFDHAGGCG